MKDNRLTNYGLIIVAALVVGLDQSACLSNDDENSAGTNGKTATPSRPAISGNTYLGLMIEDLHPAMASHVPGIGPNGQGVLVQQVGPDSPAARAGIKVHDILLTYGDQKLFNHEQLSKLVSGDPPGTEVEIRLIREGRQETVKVKLADRPTNWIDPGFLEERLPRPPRFSWRRGQPRFGPAVNLRASWNHIDSITIKRLEKNRFHAALTHVNNEGKLEKHEYEGTRDELRKLIDADDNLKANERYHLLRSLDIGDHPNPWLLFPDDDSSSF